MLSLLDEENLHYHHHCWIRGQAGGYVENEHKVITRRFRSTNDFRPRLISKWFHLRLAFLTWDKREKGRSKSQIQKLIKCCVLSQNQTLINKVDDYETSFRLLFCSQRSTLNGTKWIWWVQKGQTLQIEGTFKTKTLPCHFYLKNLPSVPKFKHTQL